MTSLEQVTLDCWRRIGIWGDRSCPELVPHVHCQNCPVFTRAGQRLLDTPPPEGYLGEWAERSAAPSAEAARDLVSVLILRLGEEWLALEVQTVAEVTGVQRVHRIPHRGGLLAGLVNVRGELHLCVHLHQLLGASDRDANGPSTSRRRMIVLRRGQETWVFAADEVDQVQRLPRAELTTPPATVARAVGHFTKGVWQRSGQALGFLDEARLFQALQERVLA